MFDHRSPSLLVSLVIQQFIVMDSRDNCATALTTLSKGTVIHYADLAVKIQASYNPNIKKLR